MNRLTMPFIVTIVLCLPLFGEARLCKSLFKDQNAIEALTTAHLELQPGEVREAGVLIDDLNSRVEIPKILQRDGSYPILVTRNKQLVISHRLPDLSVDPQSQDFLATHRALHNRLLRSDPESEILYAGQIQVIGGVASILIDQSGTFHDRAKDLGRNSTDEDLIRANQKRIDFAVAVLSQWGLISEQTRIVNFWEIFHTHPQENTRRLGHQTDREAALFELKCFGSARCWKMYEKFGSALRTIVEKGGREYVTTIIRQKDKDLFFKFSLEIQLSTSMIKEGVIEVMSQQRIVENSDNDFAFEGSTLERFFDSIDAYMQTLHSLANQ